jgi:hypothetical protein
MRHRAEQPDRTRLRGSIALAATVAALAAAGSAVAGQAATNHDGEFLDLNVAVTPPIAGSPKAVRGVGVVFDSFSGNRKDGDTATRGTSIAVRFNNGFKDNGKLFPSCEIDTTALSKCSQASQIGAGTAEAQLPGANGAPPTFIPAKLVAYNGRPLSGTAPTIIFIAVVNGKPATELDFTAKQQPTGPYGLALTQIQPSNATSPAFEISKFSVKIPDRTATSRVHGNRVTTHLIQAPTTCHGSWKFAQTDTYSDAAPLTATDFQPCTKN